MHDIDSPAGLKRRKLLLKWVCATIIIFLVNFSDYTLGFLPTYYFWRGILFPLMIFDGTLATKIMMGFENHIEGVEKWTDRIVHNMCTVYNIVYFPTFLSFIQKLDFVLSGCSQEQLDMIEKLVKTFKLNIRKAKSHLEPKKVDGVEVKESKEVVKVKKARVMNTPMRNSLQAKWEADVKMMKVGTLGKRSFFPHKIQYDVKSKKLIWQAAGDDKTSSDVLLGVRFRDNSKLILEIQLESGNKIISFATPEIADLWAKFLESQC